MQITGFIVAGDVDLIRTSAKARNYDVHPIYSIQKRVHEKV
jgi:hypothetical protein